MHWDRADLHGPVIDKHSTGGVGDKVSLMLAPLVAACGAHVPMISGRGLGHTGGTLDKLESIPGVSHQARQRPVPQGRCRCRLCHHRSDVEPRAGRRTPLCDSRCDRHGRVGRLDHGIDPFQEARRRSRRLVMDVTFGNGAFMTDLSKAEELAHSIVTVARSAGLVTNALLTDMNQVLGRTAGNALEVREAIDWLTGSSNDARLTEVVLALGAEMLVVGGLSTDHESATGRLIAARGTGAAAERFQDMVSALDGPHDLVQNPDAHLRAAAVVLRADATESGYVQAVDTRAVGLTVVALGGGRTRVEDDVDHAVGLSEVAGIGEYVDRERPLAVIHARTESEAMFAVEGLRAAFRIGDAPAEPGPVIASRITT